MSIDLTSSVPVYQQIVDYIRRAIAAGVYRPGEMIPSLRTLALELSVNPNTVQRAFEALEREGLVYARKGLGMFVTKQGAQSARERAHANVYDTFARGVRAALEANMSHPQIRQVFRQALSDHLPESRPAK